MRTRPLALLLASLATIALTLVAQANDGAPSLGAPGGADRAGRAIIERVAWESADGKGRLVIGVRGVADYTARATGADPGGNLPDRAYVDLRPAVLGKDVSRTPLAIDDGLAKQVRVGQFDPQTVRVVVDLAAPGMFEVRTSEKPPRLLLSIVPRPPRDAAVARTQGAMPEGSAAVASPPTADASAAAGATIHAPAASHAAGTAAPAAAHAPITVPAAAAHAPVTSGLPAERVAEEPAASAPPPLMARVEPTEAPPTAVPRTPPPTAAPTESPRATAAPEPPPRQTIAAPLPSPPAEPPSVVAAILGAAGQEHAAASAVVDHASAARSAQPADDDTQLAALEPPRPLPQRTPSAKAPAAKAARSPAARVWTVVIDPGHGGRDPGARGVTGSDEKDITLSIAQLLAERLADDPQIRVVLTRTDDTYVSLEQRTAIANAQGADLFLSIHGNASENPQLAGIETYTLNNTDDRATIRLAALENGLALTGASPGERDLAYILSDLVQTGKEDESVTLARAVQGNLVSYLRDRWRGVVNLGVKKGPFYVLVGAYMPCILVEVAFLTNETEGQRVAARRYQQDVADGLAIGVRRFLSSDSANSNL